MRVAAEEDEQPFSPQRHPRLRCRNGVHPAEEEGRSLKIHLQPLGTAGCEQASDVRRLHEPVLHHDAPYTRREGFDPHVMAAGDGRHTCRRGRQEHQFLMQHVIVPDVLHERRRRQFRELS